MEINITAQTNPQQASSVKGQEVVQLELIKNSAVGLVNFLTSKGHLKAGQKIEVKGVIAEGGNKYPRSFALVDKADNKILGCYMAFEKKLGKGKNATIEYRAKGWSKFNPSIKTFSI